MDTQSSRGVAIESMACDNATQGLFAYIAFDMILVERSPGEVFLVDGPKDAGEPFV